MMSILTFFAAIIAANFGGEIVAYSIIMFSSI